MLLRRASDERARGCLAPGSRCHQGVRAVRTARCSSQQGLPGARAFQGLGSVGHARLPAPCGREHLPRAWAPTTTQQARTHTHTQTHTHTHTHTYTQSHTTSYDRRSCGIHGRCPEVSIKTGPTLFKPVHTHWLDLTATRLHMSSRAAEEVAVCNSRQLPRAPPPPARWCGGGGGPAGPLRSGRPRTAAVATAPARRRRHAPLARGV